MEKFLITGGAGFIGSTLINELAKDENNFIVVADNLSTGKISNICFKKNIKFVKCDVNEYSDISPLIYFYDFDYIFHFAAVVGVKRTINSPLQVLRDMDGIKHLFNLSKSVQVKKIFFVSSSEVYGESSIFPQNEDSTPLNSNLPYAIVKNFGETMCKVYKKEYDLKYTILRLFNTYGSKQSKDFVISKFLDRALKDEDLTIYGDGEQTRSFCYIKDTVDIIMKIKKNNHFENDIVNVGSPDEISIINLAKKIIKLANSRSQIKHIPKLPVGDMQRRRPCINKLADKLTNIQFTTLDYGILDMIKSAQ